MRTQKSKRQWTSNEAFSVVLLLLGAGGLHGGKHARLGRWPNQRLRIWMRSRSSICESWTALSATISRTCSPHHGAETADLRSEVRENMNREEEEHWSTPYRSEARCICRVWEVWQESRMFLIVGKQMVTLASEAVAGGRHAQHAGGQMAMTEQSGCCRTIRTGQKEGISSTAAARPYIARNAARRPCRLGLW